MAGYLYKDEPPGWPFDPATHDDASRPTTFADSSTEHYRRRLEQFKALQAVRPELPLPEIARRMGIGTRTAARYRLDAERAGQAARREAAS